jgi:A/G-specific adenine glycosylase
METAKDTTHIRRNLLRWYRKNGRSFPWRMPETDPYVVMVSEVMLQQTQAPRVAELLPIFLERFPSVQQLSTASNAAVIMAWKGLGYNNRALRLRDAARMVMEEFSGQIPSAMDDLRRLPGIGPYASAAISTFAFNTRTIVLDVNVRRVYSRLSSWQPDSAGIAADATLEPFAQSVLPKRNPSEWYHAVMDLGATICMARRTLCSGCPLQNHCPSSHLEHTPPPLRTSQRSEPMFRGEPRRLWRGRVVQALRSIDGRVRHDDLLTMVFGVLSQPEREVVAQVLTALETDGLITRDAGYVRLSD